MKETPAHPEEQKNLEDSVAFPQMIQYFVPVKINTFKVVYTFSLNVVIYVFPFAPITNKGYYN